MKEEKFSPAVGRRKTPLDRRPNWKSKGKLRKRCCEVEGRKTTWGTTRKIQTFPHPPVNVAGKVKAAAGKAAGVADRVQASRIQEKSRKEPKNHLLPPTHSLRRNICCRRKSRRRSPAGLKREEELRKNVMELKKEGQPENPPLLPQLRARRKIWPPPENVSKRRTHTHPHGSGSNFTPLWRKGRDEPKWGSFLVQGWPNGEVWGRRKWRKWWKEGCRALSVKMEEGVRIFDKERREGVFGWGEIRWFMVLYSPSLP